MLHSICYLLDLYLMLMIIRKYSVGKKKKLCLQPVLLPPLSQKICSKLFESLGATTSEAWSPLV